MLSSWITVIPSVGVAGRGCEGVAKGVAVCDDGGNGVGDICGW